MSRLLSLGAPASHAGERRWALLAMSAVMLILFVATMQAPAFGVVIALSALVAALLFITPKVALAVLGCFLAVQPLIVTLAGGPDNPIGLALQRLHEAITVAACVRIAALATWRITWALMRPWAVYALLFLMTGLASGFVNGVPVTPLLLGAFLALKFPVFLLLALTIRWDRPDAQRVVRAGIVLGPVLLLIGVLFVLLPPDVKSMFQTAAAEREGFFFRGGLSSMQGPFVNPGVFGWAMAVSACYAVAAFLVVRARGTGVSLAASVLGVLASLRRKPLLALPISVLAGVLARRNIRQSVVGLALLSAIGVAVAAFGGDRLRLLVEETAGTYLNPYAPTTSRLLLYRTGYIIANQRVPLGAGFGRFGGHASLLYYSPLYDQYGLSDVYGLSREAPDYIEDTYWPHILGETGWLGFGVLMALLATLWRRVTTISRSALDGETRVLALGAAMALVEALVESVAAPTFESALTAFVVAVPLGMALVLGGRARRSLLNYDA